MFSIWSIVAIALGYMLFLFIVATIGNRTKTLPKFVYALALGIHCTSWAFFGTATQAAQFGWPVVPTYLGVILVMLFGFKLLLRVNTICKQYNITSIAEFISIRYDHSNLIAFVVTLICFIGVIPYIALQLDAITLALNLLLSDAGEWSGSISLYVTVGMAIFAIWFGARNMNLTDRNTGLMLTIAVQSIVKLVALLLVGAFVIYGVFDGFVDLVERSLQNTQTRAVIDKPFAFSIFISHTLLGVCSMFCLPRQFHVNFVENRHEDELHQARWIFPSYLIGMSIFVLPIGLAGMLFFESGNHDYSSDSYVLALPIAMQNYWIAGIAFLGGLAASSSMIIVATLALGNMVSNSLITPLLLNINTANLLPFRHIKANNLKLSGAQILKVRQLTILIMLCIAYAYHIHISQQTSLVETGTIALSLLSQTFPAILLGIYWRKANKAGALIGILAGVLCIILGIVFLANRSTLAEQSNGEWLASTLFISLCINFLCIFVFSLLVQSKPSNPYARSALHLLNSQVKFTDLLKLTDQILPLTISKTFREQVVFVGIQENDLAPQKVLTRAEKLLSSHMGSASTRILLNAISNQVQSKNEEFSELVEQAGKSFQFNYKVLQASITHLPVGISVVDANLKLVAWNQLYEDLLDYPSDFLQIGKPILEILQFNEKRGLLGKLNDNSKLNINTRNEIHKRMQNMLIGKSYKAVRPQIGGKVAEITGHALPAGGYITCFADITEYIHIQNELETAKIELEQRVEKRTHELEQAKNEAELANIGKTKFLAATSHDLMQPLNAASLFASMLYEKLEQEHSNEPNSHSKIDLTNNLINSLDNAESLLNTLIDITKLENNLIRPNLQSFNLDTLLAQLASEFSLLASQKSIELRYVKTSMWVTTDRRLLSRVIQNLLSNAVRYTDSGKVLLGVKRRNNLCEIIVGDTGSGIAQEFQQQIFNEFQRGNPDDSHQGLGLGLTIVDKISQLLAYKICLRSILNKGSMFSFCLPRVASQSAANSTTTSQAIPTNSLFLQNKYILLLENDESVSTALNALLVSWGAGVKSATNQEQALQLVNSEAQIPDIIIADYHLDNGDTGINTSLATQKSLNCTIKTIVSSADRSEDIQALAYEYDMQYLPKPIKQAALKRLLQKNL